MIEKINMRVALHPEEELPIYALLLDFINYPLPQWDNNAWDQSNMSLREKCLYELISCFLKTPVAETTIILNKDNKEDAINLKYHPEFLNEILKQYNESEIESVTMKPLMEAEQRNFNFNELKQVQEEIIELTEACFINKKFDSNFGGIDVQDIKYNIFFSARYGDFGESFEIMDIGTFCMFSIVKLLNSGITINKCQNCGNYFVPLIRDDEVYCNNVFSNGRTCKQLGYENKIKNDDILNEYRKAYKNKNAFKQRTKNSNPNAEKDFKKWVYVAKTKLGECQDGNLSLYEFKEWIKKK